MAFRISSATARLAAAATAVGIAVAGAAAVAAISVTAAPQASADTGRQSCTSLSTSSTKCMAPGDAEINDSLPYANVLPQWTEIGGQSGGPYGGAGGGAG